MHFYYWQAILIECRITLDALIKRSGQAAHRYQCLIVNKLTPQLLVSAQLIPKNEALAEEFNSSRNPVVKKKVVEDENSDAKSQSSARSNVSAGKFMKKKDDDSKSVGSVGTPRGEKFLKVKKESQKPVTNEKGEAPLNSNDVGEKSPGRGEPSNSVHQPEPTPRRSEPSFTSVVEGVVSERNAVPEIKDSRAKSAANEKNEIDSSQEDRKLPAGAIRVLPLANLPKSSSVESKENETSLSLDVASENSQVKKTVSNTNANITTHSNTADKITNSVIDENTDDDDVDEDTNEVAQSTRSIDEPEIKEVVDAPKRQLTINVDSDVSREVKEEIKEEKLSTPKAERLISRPVSRPPKLKESNKKSSQKELHEKLGLTPDFEYVEPERRNNERKRLDNNVMVEKSEIRGKKQLQNMRTSMGAGCIIS